MVKKPGKTSSSSISTLRKPRRRVRRARVETASEEERILKAATKHLVLENGMFLVASGLRDARVKGFKVWIISVTLRYTTGHEGYIGDLLFDGEDFTFLTPIEVRKERIRQIADDPERRRKWDEYRASTLPPGKG